MEEQWVSGKWKWTERGCCGLALVFLAASNQHCFKGLGVFERIMLNIL